MQKKLTITLDSKVYDSLHAIIGRGNISKFIEQIAKPYLFPNALAASYREMAADVDREQEALEWSEKTFRDLS